MIVKIYFSKPTVNITINNQKMLNSYIHRCLGKNNEYHNSFSDYAISSLQGGTATKDGFLLFNQNPYIIVSSNNFNFISKLINGVQFSGEEMCSMKYDRMEIEEYKTHNYFDKIVTISPILLKDKSNRKITINDDEWVNTLTNQCKSKLHHLGIDDDSFKIEIRNKNKAKSKLIWVGDVFNPCSMVSLIVYGNKKTRLALYNVGLGNSTGSGFGTIKIFD